MRGLLSRLHAVCGGQGVEALPHTLFWGEVAGLVSAATARLSSRRAPCCALLCPAVMLSCPTESASQTCKRARHQIAA